MIMHIDDFVIKIKPHVSLSFPWLFKSYHHKQSLLLRNVFVSHETPMSQKRKFPNDPLYENNAYLSYYAPDYVRTCLQTHFRGHPLIGISSITRNASEFVRTCFRTQFRGSLFIGKTDSCLDAPNKKHLVYENAGRESLTRIPRERKKEKRRKQFVKRDSRSGSAEDFRFHSAGFGFALPIY